MNKVAVLGPQVVTDLFGEGANPIGQSIRAGGQTLKLLGLHRQKVGRDFKTRMIWYLFLLLPRKNNYSA